MKKRETSKTVLGSVLIFCGCIIAACIVGWFLKLENAPDIITTIAGVASVVIGFYLWKARAENIIKIKRGSTLSEEQLFKLLEMADERKDE